MDIIAFILFVTAILIVGVLAMAGRVLWIWPFVEEGEAAEAEEAKARRRRRSAYKALVCCAIIVSYGLWLNLTIQDHNRLAGNFLPTEYHPRGWRATPPGLATPPWLRESAEWFVRDENSIPVDRGLTPEEQAAVETRLAEWEHTNVLRLWVEDGARLYILLPLALVWLVVMCAQSWATWRVRVPAICMAVLVLPSVSIMLELDYYTALRGD